MLAGVLPTDLEVVRRGEVDRERISFHRAGSFCKRLNDMKLNDKKDCDFEWNEETKDYMLWQSPLYDDEFTELIDTVEHTMIGPVQFADLTKSKDNFTAFRRFCKRWHDKRRIIKDWNLNRTDVGILLTPLFDLCHTFGGQGLGGGGIIYSSPASSNQPKPAFVTEMEPQHRRKHPHPHLLNIPQGKETPRTLLRHKKLRPSRLQNHRNHQSQPNKAVNLKAPTAAKVAIDGADVIALTTKNSKGFHPYSFIIRDACRKSENNFISKALLFPTPGTQLEVPKFSRRLSQTFGIYPPRNTQTHLHTCSIKDEREFCVVLWRVPKKEVTTAKQAWKKLEQVFDDSGLSIKVGLLRNLITTTLDNYSSVEGYINKYGHKDCYFKDKRKGYFAAFPAAVEFFGICWYIDSRASLHMCREEKWMYNVFPSSINNIKVADNKTVEVKGCGNVDFQMVNNSCDIKFEKNGCEVYQNNELILTAMHRDNTYVLNNVTEASALLTTVDETDINLRHQGMGHLSFTDLQKITESAEGVKILKKDNQIFTTCLEGKMSRLPFKNIGTRALEPLQLIHCDLCDPMETSSIGGIRIIENPDNRMYEEKRVSCICSFSDEEQSSLQFNFIILIYLLLKITYQEEVPKEEVKEDLPAQNLPVQSVHWITNRAREPLDLVLVTANSPVIDNATKRDFFKIKTLNEHSSKNCFQKARCNKCLGDYGTTAYTFIKEIDGPPACVLCTTTDYTAYYLGCA
ncbi:Retrovirus-related Pol polyprotein from transposon TNT 1-94 [Eumeta japonica]|uniref:Retrovirus-related Pol polyprotein from transposon TNT 1-94 n=1 Tax=Eumeta variegata TaxID=151549 RepID=A0A4C1WNB1_EUMVA|nr:Retrovirus-related Pol polyprotein from transposon TNT 1-94 [Eumeta japonica]